MRRLLGGLAATAALFALAPASPASALVTCNFDSGSGLLTVTIGQSTDLPELRVSAPGGPIVVSGTGVPNPGSCSGLPEVNKAARIDVLQPGSSQNGEAAIHTDVPFTPGLGDPFEGAGAPELEIRVDLGDGFDRVDLLLGEGADEVRLGALGGGIEGVDLNAGAETAGADGDDVSLGGVEELSVFAGFGAAANVIDGRGGPEFVGPLPLGLAVAGSEGDDALSAGSASSIIAGNGGNDTLRGGRGNDTLRGDAGRDTLAYDGASGGVTVNLTASAPQNTSGAGIDTLDHADNPPGDTSPDIEDLLGSPFADTLVGSDAGNRIVGGAGIDTIAALDGADDVRVDDGAAGDSADCGPGADSASADALGTVPLDTVANCEALALVDRTPPAQSQPEPQPQPGGGSTQPPSGNGAAASTSQQATASRRDTTPPTLRLSVRKKQNVGTLTARVRCLGEDCTVRGAGAVKIPGAKQRRIRARGLELAQGDRGMLRFKLARPVRRAVLAAMASGSRVSAKIEISASDAAGNGTTKKLSIALRLRPPS